MKIMLGFHTFFRDRSVSSIHGTSLNRLSERIVQGYNYEPYPFIMILSSKCNFWNDPEFRIYVHVKICFTRQYRPCSYNIMLDFKALHYNKYNLFLLLGTVGDSFKDKK